ncbi:MAG: DUF1638 domain-containing protein [Coriobacteriia bacterium]|nr:DUF1638 domain-containing protein [Coriobacteriia bacterium]
MKLKFICCNVFTRMACLAVALTKSTVDLEFVPMKLHIEPDRLRDRLQQMIDQTDQSSEDYDAIVLGFGLCGNSTAGLVSQKHKLVIPRAHDCCTLFMGSVDSYLKRFKGHLSAGWSCHGYIERDDALCAATDMYEANGFNQTFEELVEAYGEDDARYVWDIMHPIDINEPHIYIKVDPFEDMGFYERFQVKAEEDEKKRDYHKGTDVPQGSSRLLKKLMDGDWDEEFGVFLPGQAIEPSYDLEKVFI